MSNQHKHPTISFRVSDAERKQIEARILASGMMKKDYFVRSCIYNRICVVGKKETIYPLVQTVNALYLQLLEMQKVFAECCEHPTLNNLPTSNEIKERPTITICLQPSLICLMVLSICGKEYIMKQNNPCYLFDMYEPDTNSVIINAINDTYSGTPLIISCEKCNSAVLLDTPNDIAYLYRLAQENPLLYAELACKPNGLQEYVDAMNEFN